MSVARRISLGVLAATVLALVLADLSAPRPDPWMTLAAIGQGILHPDLSDPLSLLNGAVLTLAFALCGVGLGAVAGLVLAPLYHLAPVRFLCVAIRALHELFWALLLMNITGLSPLTGVLAIGLPYAGIFAKVFSEYLDEAGRGGEQALPPGLGRSPGWSGCATRPCCRRWRPIRFTGWNAVCAVPPCWASSACRRWGSSWKPGSARPNTTAPWWCWRSSSC